MTETIHFSIPLKGRFVSGDMTQKRQKDKDGRPIDPDKQRYEFCIAYPKADFWQWLTAVFYPGPLTQALAGHPQAMQNATNWFSTFSGFSMKINDGDAPNARGTVNENTKGHFAVYFQSMNPPPVYMGATPDTLQQVDTVECKRGYYVMMSCAIKFNELTAPNNGLYMNAGAVWLVEKGAEIAGGMVDAATSFAGMALPPGVQPMSLNPGAAASFSGAPQMPGAAPGFPAPAPAQMAPAGLPGQGFTPPTAAPQTAFPGNAPAAPYYGAMQPGQPPSGPAGLPGLPGLPGQH